MDLSEWIYKLYGLLPSLMFLAIIAVYVVLYMKYRQHHRTRGDDVVDEAFMSEREWKSRKRIVQTEPKRLPGHISCEQTDYVRFDPENFSWFEPSETTPDW